MTNINFYQTDAKEKVRKQKRIFSSSLFISLFVLVSTFLVYAGVRMYNSNIQDQIAVVKGKIAQESQSINRADLNRAVTFQKIVERIDANLSTKHNPAGVLGNIEKVIVKGVMLTSYESDNLIGQVILESVADNFDDVSRQILSLKESSYFSDVRVESINRDIEGKITFSLIAKYTNR